MLSPRRVNEARIQRDSPLRFEFAIAKRIISAVLVGRARFDSRSFAVNGRCATSRDNAGVMLIKDLAALVVG